MPSNTEKAAKKWINGQRKEGLSDAYIKGALLEKGYPRDLVNKLMKKSNVLPYILSALVIIALAAGIYFLFPVFSDLFVSCNTADCFIAKAENCESAKMEQNFDGSIFKLSVKNCVLTKTALKLNESEPQEIKDLLEGASMKCEYGEGNFNTDWTGTLSIGIENCSGDLKDAIDELILAL